MLSKNELALCVHPSYKQIQSVKKKKKVLLFLGNFHKKLIHMSDRIFS